jgi:hypothetical protein
MLHFVQNDFGRGFPLERGRVAVPGGEPGGDGGFQFTGAVKGSTANHAVREEGEEALHLIEELLVRVKWNWNRLPFFGLSQRSNSVLLWAL